MRVARIGTRHFEGGKGTTSVTLSVARSAAGHLGKHSRLNGIEVLALADHFVDSSPSESGSARGRTYAHGSVTRCSQ